MVVEINTEIAKAIYEALKKPRRDQEGNVGYFIATNDAFAIRMALGNALELGDAPNR